MQKPIIAVNLRGLFLKGNAWDDAHYLWYEQKEKELKKQSKDTSAIDEWRQLLRSNPNEERKTYFRYVDKVMESLYPNFKEEERTARARETYFDAVCQYLKKHPEARNEEVIKYFKSLKDSYRIALITANTQEALDRIIKVSKLEGLFDIFETSLPTEKDDKLLVIERFLKKHGRPLSYIGGEKASTYDYCKKYKIPHIFANLEGQEEIPGVKSVHNLRELKEALKRLI